MSKTIFENLRNFKRGLDTNKALDIGIEREDNPNSLANSKSFHVNKTNEEVIGKMISELGELHRAIDTDLNPTRHNSSPSPDHPKTDWIRSRIFSIEKEFIALIDLLKTIKR